ncbi:MAG: N4-gp56 family major capsid protein [Nitrososphaerales archaeon]
MARKLWSEKLYREALKETWINRLMGEGADSAVQVLKDTQKSAGDRIRVGLRMQLSGAGVSGDGTLEGNEVALDFFSDDLTIDQLRQAVRSQGKASEQRVPYDMREEAYEGLRDWWAGRIDESGINQLVGNVNQTDVRFTGMQTVTAPGKILAGTHDDSIGSLSASLSIGTVDAIGRLGIIGYRTIDRAVAHAKTVSPFIRPVRIMGDEYYMALLHPNAVFQLRRQTSSGEWADIQKAAIQGGKISDNPIFMGSIGIYNGVVLHESVRLPTAISTPASGVAADFRMGVFMGAQAAAMAFGADSDESPNWTEELFDYGNKLGVAAGMVWGLKRMRFNGTDFASVALAGYAPNP